MLSHLVDVIVPGIHCACGLRVRLAVANITRVVASDGADKYERSRHPEGSIPVRTTAPHMSDREILRCRAWEGGSKKSGLEFLFRLLGVRNSWARGHIYFVREMAHRSAVSDVFSRNLGLMKPMTESSMRSSTSCSAEGRSITELLHAEYSQSWKIPRLFSLDDWIRNIPADFVHALQCFSILHG